MTRSPTFTELLDWVDGRLPPAAERSVGRLVATGDAQVQASLAWIRAFQSSARSLPLLSPPVELRDHLRRIFRERYDEERLSPTA